MTKESSFISGVFSKTTKTREAGVLLYSRMYLAQLENPPVCLGGWILPHPLVLYQLGPRERILLWVNFLEPKISLSVVDYT